MGWLQSLSKGLSCTLAETKGYEIDNLIDKESFLVLEYQRLTG